MSSKEDSLKNKTNNSTIPSSNYPLANFLFKPEFNELTKSILLAHSRN